MLKKIVGIIRNYTKLNLRYDVEFKKHQEELIQIIQKSVIFSQLTRAQSKSLLKLSEEVCIKQGEILFHKGDISDNMYLVLEGQMIATMETPSSRKNIGSIHVGETIGELGALSQKPRSLTVYALYDCRLLKLSRTAIIKFWKLYSSAEFHMQMLNQIIDRSQSVIKLLANEKLMKHILMIPATEELISDDFIQMVKKQIQACHNLILVDMDYFTQHHIEYNNANIRLIINRADAENKKILFIIEKTEIFQQYINQYDDFNVKNILNHIDALYLIAPADAKPHLHPEVEKILCGNFLPFITRKELVLCHQARPSDTIDNTSDWLSLGSFTLHHHMRKNNDKDFQRLIRFIINMPVGLIIGGGGMKAISALGIIKALEENNIPIDAVGGTSAGATISSLYALYQNFSEAYEAMYPCFDSGTKALKFKHLTYPIISINDGRVINERVLMLFSNKRSEDLWLPNFTMATNLNTCEEIVQSRGLVWENIPIAIESTGNFF